MLEIGMNPGIECNLHYAVIISRVRGRLWLLY